jgi:hypothetical protein
MNNDLIRQDDTGSLDDPGGGRESFNAIASLVTDRELKKIEDQVRAENPGLSGAALRACVEKRIGGGSQRRGQEIIRQSQVEFALGLSDELSRHQKTLTQNVDSR